MKLADLRELAAHHQAESETAYRRADNLRETDAAAAEQLTVTADWHQRFYLKLTGLAEAFQTFSQLTSNNSLNGLETH